VGKEKPLTYRERREWESLPGRIEALEQELAGVHLRMADPDFYKSDPEDIRRAVEASQRIPAEIEALYARWGELER